MARRSHIQGGQKLDLFLRNLGKTLRDPKDVEVGIFSDARYSPDARRTPHYGEATDLVAHVAQRHEYGYGVPKRPFFRTAINALERSSTLDQAIKAMVTDDGTIEDRSYDLVGQIAADAIKLSIVRLRQPPNSQRTIAIKGSNNPLVDTGYMLSAVTWRVKS